MSERGNRSSHAIETLRKKVVVPASPDAAFRRFTREIGAWWPVARFSVHGEAVASVEFGEEEGGRVVERGPDGEEAVWGTVTAWDPPRRVAFTWHPGRPASSAQELDLKFVATGDGGTEVTLAHGGWEALGEGAVAKRAEYDGGWDYVLTAYRDSL